MKPSLLHIFLFFTFLLFSAAELRAGVTILVTDSETGEPLEFATVILSTPEGEKLVGGATDISGMDTAPLGSGQWLVNVSLVGYKPYRQTIELTESKAFSICLSNSEMLNEIVVTAREARDASSTSIIDTTAMAHLQPSSFTDILELKIQFL